MGFELHVSVDCIQAVHSHQANSLANGNAGAGCNLFANEHDQSARQIIERREKELLTYQFLSSYTVPFAPSIIWNV
jgi:hypothetical protein